jgi:hypothetical protein
MGYTTTFSGRIEVHPPLNSTEIEYLNRFASTRRMDRTKGPYYANHGSDGFGQDRELDIIEYNRSPEGQPGLWCGWVPTNDGTAIVWNKQEKFYDSQEWMKYLIEHFLKPGGHAQGKPEFSSFTFDHVCNGVIYAQGEEIGDSWSLVVRNNKVTEGPAPKEYMRPENRWAY